MAKSLKIKIEMAGAEEIKSQLEGVGEAGEECFNKILNAAKQAGGFKELDPGFLKEAFDELGTKAPEAIGKITQAVQSASRMETLVNALTSVENGLGKIQAAATSMDAVLGKALVRSLTMVARLLPAAFAASTVGAIAVTTKSLLELDKAAIKVGVSVDELARAQEIFKQLGASSKEAAAGVAEFFEKFQLDKVKEAIAALDEFGRPLRTNIDAMRILQEAAKGVGEAADLARKALEKWGRLDTKLSPAAQAINDIKQSSMSASEQILKMLGVFDKMGNTAERNRLIFQNFGKELGTFIIQALNAGLSMEEITKHLDGFTAPTKEATKAAFLLGLEWQKLKNMFSESFTVSPEALNMITKILGVVREAIVAFGQLKSVAGTLNIGGNTLRELVAIGAALTYIGNLAVSIWNGFVSAAQTAANAVLQFFANLPGQIAAFFGEFGTNLWEGFKQGASLAVGAVLQFFSELPGQIAAFFAGFGANLWDGIVQSAAAAWGKITGYIQTAINKLKEFFSSGGTNPGGVTATPGMARGGMIGGRGTGTSDSNLAWVSRGEHVMPASVVRQPGVLQLLEALRRSGGNLRGVLDRMGHFALGGMVSAPAFARGGAVGGMSNVTINFPGMQPVTGLRASSAVVDELRRSAALAQARSGGRKPSRYT